MQQTRPQSATVALPRYCRHHHRRPSRRLLRIVRAQTSRGVDLLGLGNLCVDVRIPVRRLPSQKPGWRNAVWKDFENAPSRDSVRELGGVSNTLFTASRLGLHAAVVAHVGRDQHAEFCKQCLDREGIEFVDGFVTDGEVFMERHPFLENTAICLVLVDPSQRHMFCSQFEVEPGPVFCDPSTLKTTAMQEIRDAKALVMSGYAFQECSGEVLEFVFDTAVRSGTTTFFDPGPFGVELSVGTESEKSALMEVLRRSNVILATNEEAEAITGESDLKEMGRALLRLGDGVTKWVVIKLGAAGSLFFQQNEESVLHTAGFQVHVLDTVGCGDSFAAAVAYGYLHRQGEKPNGVMELANAIGAITATGCGAGRNVANLNNVQALLKNCRKQRNGRSGIDAALDLLRNMRQDPLHLQNSESTFGA